MLSMKPCKNLWAQSPFLRVARSTCRIKKSGIPAWICYTTIVVPHLLESIICAIQSTALSRRCCPTQIQQSPTSDDSKPAANTPHHKPDCQTAIISLVAHLHVTRYSQETKTPTRIRYKPTRSKIKHQVYQRTTTCAPRTGNTHRSKVKRSHHCFRDWNIP